MVFQSTLPQGERHVSPSLNLANFQDFNPRSHKGSDDISNTSGWRNWTFQSTLPQGERLTSTQHCPHRGLFQSTLPQGERQFCPHNSPYFCAFQSTLPQGERRQRAVLKRWFWAFQSTLPQGERLYIQALPCRVCNFNPRSHKGSDKKSRRIKRGK